VEKVLVELLERLAAISQDYGELQDTEVRERLDDAIHHGFLLPTPSYKLPNEFAMYSKEGNHAVHKILQWFLKAANAAADTEGLNTFHKRLAAFQNLDVTAGPQQLCYNDFFGWANPKRYDESGSVIPEV
jgi:hypothetical protein